MKESSSIAPTPLNFLPRERKGSRMMDRECSLDSNQFGTSDTSSYNSSFLNRCNRNEHNPPTCGSPTYRLNQSSDTPTTTLQMNDFPIGFLGFGIAGIVTAIAKLVPTASPSETIVKLVGVIFGGIGQMIAAYMYQQAGSSVMATMFAVYGLHWIRAGMESVVYASFDRSLEKSSLTSKIVYDVTFCIITLFFLIPALRAPRVHFLNIALLLAMLLTFFSHIFEQTGNRFFAFVAGICLATAAFVALLLAAVDIFQMSSPRGRSD